MDIHHALSKLGLELPPTPKAVAVYVPALRSGNHLFISGQLPTHHGELTAKGLVDQDVDLEQAQAAARHCTLNALAAVDQALAGDWSKFGRIVRLGAFVSSSPGFTDQHKVANGASELLGEIFGDAGRHVRSTVGVASLPLNAPVEIELTVEVR